MLRVSYSELSLAAKAMIDAFLGLALRGRVISDAAGACLACCRAITADEALAETIITAECPRENTLAIHFAHKGEVIIVNLTYTQLAAAALQQQV